LALFCFIKQNFEAIPLILAFWMYTGSVRLIGKHRKFHIIIADNKYSSQRPNQPNYFGTVKHLLVLQFVGTWLLAATDVCEMGRSPRPQQLLFWRGAFRESPRSSKSEALTLIFFFRKPPPQK
jgi:hypothetical protein